MSKSIRFKWAGWSTWWDQELIKQISQTSHWFNLWDAIRVSWENTYTASFADNSNNADVEWIVIEIINADVFKFKLLWASIWETWAVPNEPAWTLLYLSASTPWLLTSTAPSWVWEIIKSVAKISIQNSEMITFNIKWEEIT